MIVKHRLRSPLFWILFVFAIVVLVIIVIPLSKDATKPVLSGKKSPDEVGVCILSA